MGFVLFVLLFDCNGSTSRTSQEVHHFLAKFHHYGLRNGIFFENFHFGALVFFCNRIQIRVNLCCFSIGNGSTSKTSQEVHRFWPNSIISASEMAFLIENFHFGASYVLHRNLDSRKFVQKMGQRAGLCKRFIVFHQIPSFRPPKGHIFDNFCFGARIFFWCQNLDLCKFVQLFNWKWVDEQDSVGGLSFFGQILSFWTPKRHFFENSRFGGYFILRQNSDSGKFVQLFDWKWVNEQDSIGCSSFFGQIPSFRPQKWYFFQKFHFAARFFFAPKFKLAQICAIFRLEMGQRAGLHKRFIVFRPNSFVSVYDMAFFFENFHFGAHFFAPKFRFPQICTAF